MFKVSKIHNSKRRRFVRKAGILWVPAFLSLTLQLAAQKNVLDGVYTQAQAMRGQAIFVAECRSCHSYDNLGGPEAQSLKGARFIEAWREDSLESLFTKMRRTMPPPGALLNDEQYVDVIAFLLEANEYASGMEPLQTLRLRSIQLVGKNGPQPLPNLSLVKSVGCITPGPNNTWLLTKATPLARTREANESSREEIKISSETALADRSYPLRNIENAEQFSGRKVQAKGVLSRQQATDRINVMSIEALDGVCGSL